MVYHLDEESLQVDLRSKIEAGKRGKGAPATNFVIGAIAERNVGKAGRLSLSECKLADVSAKVNDMVDT